MSHVASVKTQVKDRNLLARVCSALGLPHVPGPQTVDLYERAVAGDFSVKLPGWNYPVVVNTATGEVHFDNYAGRWGDSKQLDKLLQEYAVAVVEEQTYQLTLQGWTVERQTLANGDVQIVLSQGL